LNSGENANVVSLTRDKNVFTLVMDVWQDDFPRAKNIPWRKGFQLSIGNLEAGEYEFRTVHRHMRMDDKTEQWHQFKSELVGKMDFLVTDPRDKIKTKAVLLKEDDLRDAKDKPAGLGSYRQYPECQSKTIVTGIPTKDAVTAPDVPRLEAGTFDLKKWSESNPRSLADLPKLKPAEKGDPVYATLLGPWQTTGWVVTLREIEWKDKDAIVRVDFWSDTEEGRHKDQPSLTCLVMPLKAAPGDYRVKLEWTFLSASRSPTPGELYTPQDPAKAGDNAPINQFNKKSPVKVTIK
jgi:hypothetical protein